MTTISNETKLKINSPNTVERTDLKNVMPCGFIIFKILQNYSIQFYTFDNQTNINESLLPTPWHQYGKQISQFGSCVSVD
jgi:hypothetical protein